jgi:hypothetical protein
MATGDWLDAGKYAAATLAAPKAAQVILNNPAAIRYMSEGLANPTARSLLEAPAKNKLVGLLAQRSPAMLAGLLSPAAQE